MMNHGILEDHDNQWTEAMVHRQNGGKQSSILMIIYVFLVNDGW